MSLIKVTGIPWKWGTLEPRYMLQLSRMFVRCGFWELEFWLLMGTLE